MGDFFSFLAVFQPKYLNFNYYKAIDYREYYWFRSKILTFDEFMGKNLSNLVRMPKYGHMVFASQLSRFFVQEH